MLFFLITCSLSFILFYKSLSLKPLASSASEMRLLSIWFWKDFSLFPIAESIRNTLLGVVHKLFSPIMSPKKNKNFYSKVENLEITSDMSVLDLPDLVLECILEKLPTEGLCRMASVCSSLRERCISDHLWEKHMKNKWGRIISTAAHREWQWHIASRKGSIFSNQGKQRSLMGYLTLLWPISLIRSSFGNIIKKDFPPADSIMSWYLALESGNFWFPAQVYNRENGHVGFVLSCYDAKLSYDRWTDTFQARYPPHGRRASAVETGVTWDRLRAPPVDNSPHDLHISDCLNELRPGDHIEIQWRRNKEFPYGWWYGVVGHLETCDGNANYCPCHDSETLVLEFNQYARGSRWRTKSLNRKDHREEGNEADGFYGGIRKLKSNEETSVWKKLWPAEVLE
ncbi:F-box protein At2g32560-like [Olea europaea var. sylvestris]|uniref:F-box At2g32560-like n=1 Tax=Olea europaea subsp. europaea TaxID=158383 RepID=A0A8S0SZT4_OLEEU|nr:F-box protein At2g32560-like [Olea europaea var. sylvestris]CAA2997302.1 F-box At2g32560-like [Olea europaea subsp. europaea]